MALCDFLITQDITGYDCNRPPQKGVERRGILVNRKDVNYGDEYWITPFSLDYLHHPLKCETTGYNVYQSGKTPFNGTQQEMQEGANANTITNTLQIVVLRQDENWAQQLFALMNGEFVAYLQNKDGSVQIYGYEAGLHCTGAVRELYSDDTLAGWQITFTEEGASKGNIFLNGAVFNTILTPYACE